jgi:multidrug efflux system outer membrane protein
MRGSAPGLFALLVLGGCLLGPDYRRPELNAPDRFLGGAQRAEQADRAQADRASLADLPWWQVFSDPALVQLVREGLVHNLDLHQAMARIDQARAAARISGSGLFPSLSYEANAYRGKNAFLGRALPGGLFGSLTNDSFFAALDVSWEIDLFGRLRRLNQAAEAELLATEAAERGVIVSLIASIAESYFELLELDLELEIARRTTRAFEDSRHLFADRYQGGVASRLEVRSAEAAAADTAAKIPDLERQIDSLAFELSVLLGRYPGAIEGRAKLVDQVLLPEVPGGLGSDLLQRRPDLVQAEAAVIAANARVGATFADFFPRISLTGLFGTVTTELAQLVKTGAQTWSFGALVSGPIFQGGKVLGAHEQARGAFEEAALAYRAQVLNAFREVSEALTAHAKLAEVRIERDRAVTAYREVVDVALDRYKGGQASYYEVLQAQEQLFSEENALALVRRDQLLAVVRLYKALGGGWRSEAKPLEQ